MQVVLTSLGTTLTKDNEGFVVCSSEGRQRIPADCVSSFLIGKGVSVSSDAMILAVQKEVDITLIDRAGTPIGRMWSPRYGSIASIRKGQLEFCISKDGVEWIKDILCQKITNQQALISMMPSKGIKTDNIKSRALTKLDKYSNKISSLEASDVTSIASKLRGFEGMASKTYFETLNYFIPEQYRFEERSQHPAFDIANAMLNYGYGILYGKIEIALVKCGIDPYVGLLHSDQYNKPVLVYDVIEVFRMWVDYIVYSILEQEAITDDYYSVSEDGSVWLENLGRRVMIQSMNDYLDEVITISGLQRSRGTQIDLFAQRLAQKFKNIL